MRRCLYCKDRYRLQEKNGLACKWNEWRKKNKLKLAIHFEMLGSWASEKWENKNEKEIFRCISKTISSFNHKSYYTVSFIITAKVVFMFSISFSSFFLFLSFIFFYNFEWYVSLFIFRLFSTALSIYKKPRWTGSKFLFSLWFQMEYHFNIKHWEWERERDREMITVKERIASHKRKED